MISNRQLKAARCLMALSRAEVARRSGLGFGTIGKLEHYGADDPENGSLNKLVAMYQAHGVRFLDNGVMVQRDRAHDSHRTQRAEAEAAA